MSGKVPKAPIWRASGAGVAALWRRSEPSGLAGVAGDAALEVEALADMLGFVDSPGFAGFVRLEGLFGFGTRDFSLWLGRIPDRLRIAEARLFRRGAALGDLL